MQPRGRTLLRAAVRLGVQLMARTFAQVQLRIWVDDEFTALSVEAQHLYMLLLSQEDIGPSGLIPLRPRRWAKLAANGSVDNVMASLAELDAASFLVVDEETAEVLVRTFIRNGENYKHVRLLRTALNQAERAESTRIRSALGQELALLPAVVVPELTGRNLKAVEEAEIEQKHLNEVVSMLVDAPPDPGHGMGSWDDAKGWGHPTVPVTVPVPVPARGLSSTENPSSLVGNAHARPDLSLIAHCYEHPGELRRNCRGCAADRKGVA
jgi:hypothetical protein